MYNVYPLRMTKNISESECQKWKKHNGNICREIKHKTVTIIHNTAAAAINTTVDLDSALGSDKCELLEISEQSAGDRWSQVHIGYNLFDLMFNKRTKRATCITFEEVLKLLHCSFTVITK